MGLCIVVSFSLVQLATLIGLGAMVTRVARVKASWVAMGWCGFAVFLVAAELAHVFFPLGHWFGPAMAVLGAFGWKYAFERRPRHAALLLLPVVALSFAALAPVFARDNGLYFIQSTLWLRDFAAVPGLGNLHPCLGANHAYFAWVAAWAVGPVHEQPWLVANVALLTLACAPGILAVAKWRKPNVSEAVGIVLLGPLFDVALSGQLSSPVADIGLACVQTALTLWFIEACTRKVERNEAMLAAFVAVAFATLKLAGAYQAVVVWGFMVFALRRQPRAVVITMLVSVSLIIPWLVNGLISTGYPLYPTPAFGLPVTWRVPEEVARAYLNVSSAQHHALVLYDRSGVLRGDWPLFWLERTWVDNRTFLIPAVLWLTGLVASLLRRDRALLRFSLGMGAALVLWFVVSPELRFAQLTLWGAGAGTLAMLLRTRTLRFGVVSAAIIGWAFVEAPLPRLTFALPAAPAWNSRTFTLKSGDELKLGDGNFDCYELPCALCPYESLRLREPGNLAAGFQRDPADTEFFECGGLSAP